MLMTPFPSLRPFLFNAPLEQAWKGTGDGHESKARHTEEERAFGESHPNHHIARLLQAFRLMIG